MRPVAHLQAEWHLPRFEASHRIRSKLPHLQAEWHLPRFEASHRIRSKLPHLQASDICLDSKQATAFASEWHLPRFEASYRIPSKLPRSKQATASGTTFLFAERIWEIGFWRFAKMFNRAGVIYETPVLWWQSGVLTLDLPGIKSQSGLTERLQR
jgi:hypothetical protein